MASLAQAAGRCELRRYRSSRVVVLGHCRLSVTRSFPQPSSRWSSETSHRHRVPPPVPALAHGHYLGAHVARSLHQSAQPLNFRSSRHGKHLGPPANSSAGAPAARHRPRAAGLRRALPRPRADAGRGFDLRLRGGGQHRRRAQARAEGGMRAGRHTSCDRRRRRGRDRSSRHGRRGCDLRVPSEPGSRGGATCRL